MQATSWNSRSAVQLGNPPGSKVVSRLGKAETEPASPTGAVRLTRPPNRFGEGAVGASKARLSFAVQVSVSPRPMCEVLAVATSVSVLQRALGDAGDEAPSTLKPSVPTWKQGATASDEPLAELLAW